MQICTLASSSSGNCCLVSNGDTHVLIDAGISMRRITKSLADLGLCPRDLAGILVTHEHSDHISGIKMMVKYHSVPIMVSKGVGSELCKIVPETQQHLKVFEVGKCFQLGSIEVNSFYTPHDTPESVGYRLCGDNKTISFATDIGCVTREIFDMVSGSDVAVIEANHDVQMLKNGAYPVFLKRRILSDHGHLSNDDSGTLAVRIAEAGTRKIILAHLSRENNTPRIAYDTVSCAFKEAGAVVGGDVELSVAPASEMGNTYTA